MQYFPSQWHQFQQQGILDGKLRAVAEQLAVLCPDVDRFSVAVYDAQTDQLSTYYSTSHADEAITRYQAKLSDVPSLQMIRDNKIPRVINELLTLQTHDTDHSQRLLAQGWRSSYTVPMCYSDRFMGFLFFNSKKPDVFIGEKFMHIELISQLITLLIHDELTQTKTLKAALKSALALTSGRDIETGQHLERMGYYSRIIAHQVADQYGENDQFVEQIFHFAPVHDIGKIAIPDHILLKPAKLDQAEYELMQTHTLKGAAMLEDILQHHGLDDGDPCRILRNIVLSHHELLDGSGYPFGLQAEDIPLEARIVAVADIFDALTSKRPYKAAWNNEQALETLQKMAGEKLCADCVQALVDKMDEVEQIQALYDESYI